MIINVTPGILPIPPNGWGAVEKIIWEYHQNFQNIGLGSEILYLNEVQHNSNTIVHIHVANLALIAHEMGIPYYFTCHDHHAFLYGKDSKCFKENYDAIKHSIKSFVPAKYLVDYFNLPNLYYLSHGVNKDIFKTSNVRFTDHKLLCVANNGFIHDPTEDRKGFLYAVKAAQKLNLPITIAGPSNNKKFFDRNTINYNKLTILYDLSETDLVKTYQNHTIFLSPSILEAGHPNLTLLEAMSCGLPVISTFEDNNHLDGLVRISRDVDDISNAIQNVIRNYEIFKKYCEKTSNDLTWKNITLKLLNYYNINMKDKLIKIYNDAQLRHIDPVEETNKIHFEFNCSAKVEINGPIDKSYEVKFINNQSKSSVYDTTINNNMWAASSIEYFVDWKIDIKELDTGIHRSFNLDLKDKIVKIVNESPSLGDYVAWIPYIEEFRKKHNCHVDFYTPNKHLFDKSYRNINFYNYNDVSDKKYYAVYKIGCFDPNDRKKSPRDYRTQNLQQIASDILGLSYKEIIPDVIVDNIVSTINEKYVCISTASTAGCKHWQNVGGWQQVVDYLTSLNYKVVVLQKEPLNYMDLQGLKNVIHPETKNIQEVLTWLYNCEFFIGLSSGVSWLAWCLKKPVILISGFTKTFNEFHTPYRVINENVCNGCWNNTDYKFNGGDWNWCPKFKNTERQFECSKSITFDMVKKNIDIICENKDNFNRPNFDKFTYKEIFEWNQYEKFVTVENNDVVLDLGCSKGYFYLKHKNKNIKYIGLDGSIDCLKDFIENIDEKTDDLQLIHAIVGKNKDVKSFTSMFHGNRLQESMQISFRDLLQLIDKPIDFLKFDIEGYEKYIFEDHYDLFKTYIKKFSGEIHLGDYEIKQSNIDILNKLINDCDIKLKIFSIDGVDITTYFWTNIDYYTEIIISGEMVNKSQKV